jgi:D-glycerate 3-kinase
MLVAVVSLNLDSSVQEFLQREQLPPEYLEAIDNWYRPLTVDIARLRQQQAQPLVLGVQGAQGTGKSTLAGVLALLLSSEHGMVVAQVSLDDFYLSRGSRRGLAAEVHPLLATRGVPGTHDVALALATLDALCRADAGSRVALPRFDKASDDCRDPAQWPQIIGPVDVVVLEGWCLGAPPQSEASLQQAINVLEQQQDTDGSWRRYVNAQLAGAYRELFERIDFLVVLQAPSFDCVYRWRGLQEQKLAAGASGSEIMNAAQLRHFIAHYERLSRHCLSCLPALAQRVYYLDDAHRVISESAGVQRGNSG